MYVLYSRYSLSLWKRIDCLLVTLGIFQAKWKYSACDLKYRYCIFTLWGRAAVNNLLLLCILQRHQLNKLVQNWDANVRFSTIYYKNYFRPRIQQQVWKNWAIPVEIHTPLTDNQSIFIISYRDCRFQIESSSTSWSYLKFDLPV